MLNQTGVDKISAWLESGRKVRIQFGVATRHQSGKFERTVISIDQKTGWLKVRFEGTPDFIVFSSEVSRVDYL